MGEGIVLEVGKPYKTRGGWKAVVFCQVGTEFKVNHGDNHGGFWWHDHAGRWDRNYPDYDLISEWEEPTSAENAQVQPDLPTPLKLCPELDPEIQRIWCVVQLFDRMTPAEQSRALGYLNGRFGV